jgi:hypothetical protein
MSHDYYVVLEISTWAGMSFGAEHYYGALVGYINGEYTKKDIQKAMSKEKAKKLCEKDDWKYYKEGSLTNRFDTKQEIREVALATWQAIFPDAKALLEGHFSSAEPMKVLWVKNSEYKDEMNKIWEKNERIPHIPANDKKIDALIEKFDTLLGKATGD